MSNFVSFGSDEMYIGGFTTPPGKYACEFKFIKPAGKGGAESPFIYVQITSHSLQDPEHQGENAHKERMGMGQAHLSFAIDPDSGTRLIPIAGAAGMTLSDQCTWNIFRESLKNCGLPSGILDDDFSTINGVHIQLGRRAEPDYRGATSATSESAMAGATEKKTPRTIPVCLELGDIIEGDNGKPWEGGGGVPDRAAKPKGKAKVGPKVVAKPTKVAPAPVVEEESGDDEVLQAATDAVTDVLTKKPAGCPALALRTAVFGIAKKVSQEMADAVIDTYFTDTNKLRELLESLMLGEELQTYTLSADGKTVVKSS